MPLIIRKTNARCDRKSIIWSFTSHRVMIPLIEAVSFIIVIVIMHSRASSVRTSISAVPSPEHTPRPPAIGGACLRFRWEATLPPWPAGFPFCRTSATRVLGNHPATHSPYQRDYPRIRGIGTYFRYSWKLICTHALASSLERVEKNPENILNKNLFWKILQTFLRKRKTVEPIFTI